MLKSRRIETSEGFAYYYFSRKNNSLANKSLIILLVGSGVESVISDPMKFSKYLYCSFQESFDFLIPDKINIHPFHQNDLRSILKYYTFEHRVYTAIEAISTFLKNSEKKYNQIQIWGVSEGGKILPKVFSKIKNDYNITGLVLWASGGMSQYEEFCILRDKNSLNLDDCYLTELGKIDKEKIEIFKDPRSLNKMYLGWPYRRWSSFLDYQPIQDMQEILIPILCIHGGKDVNCPVESSRFIKKYFKLWNKDNLTYWEFPKGDHYNMNFKKIICDAVQRLSLN